MSNKNGLPQRALLASAIGLVSASASGLALAADSNKLELGTVNVDGKAEKTYKVTESASAKYTAPLLDTRRPLPSSPRRSSRSSRP